MSTSSIDKPKAGPVSRYDGGYDARIPANGLARPVPSINVRTAVVAIPDPLEPNRRLKATVNRRVDILEQERSHKRITEAAYLTGRVAQAIFERASGAKSPSFNPGDRIDTTLARELSVIMAIEDARTIAAYEKWIISVLGQIDARLLRSIIRDRRTFAQAAADRGRSSERGKAYFAERFRDALEQLAHALAARGKASAPIRGERNSPVAGEEYDRNGILVPEGEKGYRVGGDSERLAQ
jgi:hypothetical protein